MVRTLQLHRHHDATLQEDCFACFCCRMVWTSGGPNQAGQPKPHMLQPLGPWSGHHWGQRPSPAQMLSSLHGEISATGHTQNPWTFPQAGSDERCGASCGASQSEDNRAADQGTLWLARSCIPRRRPPGSPRRWYYRRATASCRFPAENDRQAERWVASRSPSYLLPLMNSVLHKPTLTKFVSIAPAVVARFEVLQLTRAWEILLCTDCPPPPVSTELHTLISDLWIQRFEQARLCQLVETASLLFSSVTECHLLQGILFRTVLCISLGGFPWR